MGSRLIELFRCESFDFMYRTRFETVDLGQFAKFRLASLIHFLIPIQRDTVLIHGRHLILLDFISMIDFFDIFKICLLIRLLLIYKIPAR